MADPFDLSSRDYDLRNSGTRTRGESAYVSNRAPVGCPPRVRGRLSVQITTAYPEQLMFQESAGDSELVADGAIGIDAGRV